MPRRSQLSRGIEETQLEATEKEPFQLASSFQLRKDGNLLQCASVSELPKRDRVENVDGTWASLYV